MRTKPTKPKPTPKKKPASASVELRSANEELNTLNAELRHKNNDLHELSNDVTNLLNSTRLPVVMLDRGLRIRRVTPMAGRLLKVVSSDIGRPIADIPLNIDAPELESMIGGVLENLQPAECEVRDAEGRWNLLNILPYRTQENKIDGVVLALQDIDAIKVANEKLTKAADFFHGVMDTVVEPLLVLDAELRVVMANEPFFATFKVSAQETLNRFVYGLGNGQWDIPELRSLLEDILPKRRIVRGFTVNHEFETIGARTMLLNAQTLASVPDATPMILLAIEDITERRRADTSLRESEQRFRTLFDSVPMGVLVCDRDAVIRDYNQSARQLWGREPARGAEQYCGSLKMWKPDGTPLDHDKSPMAEVLRTGVPASGVEISIERPDGSRLPVLANFAVLRNAQGEISGAVGTFMDIHERKDAELPAARLAAIVESSDDAIIGKDLNGIIESWNASAQRLFGYTPEEAIGRSITMLIPPDHLDEEPVILDHIRRGEHIEHFESIRRRKDGSLRHVALTISPIIDSHGQIVGASKIARDVTEQKLAEASLIRSEKLVAAGRLAATLAHEINNPLQAITNLMTLLRHSPRLDEQEQSYAAMMEEELGRVVHLTQQSLSFYRESAFPVAVHLDAVADSVLNLYADRLRTRRIAVTRQYLSDGVTIRSFPGEIRQVLSTLLLNAMEAIPSEGDIVIRIHKSSSWNHKPCPGIRITIADNGFGIAPNNAARIFEPFFTTKGEQGTGLGLWVANGIINRLGGTIQMRSSTRPEKSGTSFSIFLPLQLPDKALVP